MRIRYDVTLDDVVALNHHHIRHSPFVRRRMTFLRWLLPGVLLAYFLAVATVRSPTPAMAVWMPAGWVAVSVVWMLVFPRLMRWKSARQVRQLYAEGKNQGMVGPHELELTGDELIHRSSVSESRLRCSAIERVDTDGGYTFLYVSATSAHIIPHAAVTEGDPEAFADAVRQKLADDPPAA